MLSINETMNSIVRRISLKSKAYRDVFEVSRSSNQLVIGASCIEQERSSLARILIEQIKSMNLMNKPDVVSFNLDCDLIECRVVCTWKA